MNYRIGALCCSILLLMQQKDCQAAVPAKRIRAPRTLATVQTGVNPAGVAITLDSKTAYVANNNNYGIPGGDSVTVIDLTTYSVKTTIQDASFNQPYTATLSRDGTKVYITNSNTTTISIIDVATNTVIGVIDGFDGPSGMAISPDGTIAYVNNYGSPPPGVGSGHGTLVSIVNLENDIFSESILLEDPAPSAVALTPDGSTLYIASYVDGQPGTGTVTVYDTRIGMITNVIPGFSGPFKIAIPTNDVSVYVTNFGSNNFSPIGTTVSIFDIATQTRRKDVKVGIQPAGIAISPNSPYAYVTLYDTLETDPTTGSSTAGQGVVAIIDTKTNTVIAPSFAVGQSPGDIAISPDGSLAVITNYTSNTATIVDVLERMWAQ